MDGKQAPSACPLLVCMRVVSGLGSGQWPEGSALASRAASDPHLRQSTRLGEWLHLGICSFLVEIRNLNLYGL